MKTKLRKKAGNSHLTGLVVLSVYWEVTISKYKYIEYNKPKKKKMFIALSYNIIKNKGVCRIGIM